MNMDNIYLISDIPGYSPQISRLISMMNYARYTTIEEVKDLSIDQLDFCWIRKVTRLEHCCCTLRGSNTLIRWRRLRIGS